ncbi:zinc-binding dehydrogenase [Pseudomonas lini]
MPTGYNCKKITSLIEAGVIKPVIDRSFPFESTAEALRYVEQGRSKRQSHHNNQISALKKCQ